MTTKKRNIIALMLHSVICVLYFIPGFTEYTYWLPEGWGGWRSLRKESISAFDRVDQPGFVVTVFGMIAMAIAVVATILLICQLVKKGNKQNSLLCAYIPCAELLFVALFGVLDAMGIAENAEPGKTYLSYEPQYIFIIIGALLLGLSVFSIITYVNYKKTGVVEDVTVSNKTTTESQNITDLEEYHKLLDNGVITQEEFDAKKKQILGL